MEVIEALRDSLMIERAAELTPADLAAAKNAADEFKTAYTREKGPLISANFGP